MASTFISINSRFYCVMNVYNQDIYVHITNRYDKKKKLSMKYSDLMDFLGARDSFEKGLERLKRDGDSDDSKSDDSDCDGVKTEEEVAYKLAKDSRSPPAKKKKTSERSERR